jgi:hypothetical protein
MSWHGLLSPPTGRSKPLGSNRRTGPGGAATVSCACGRTGLARRAGALG